MRLALALLIALGAAPGQAQDGPLPLGSGPRLYGGAGVGEGIGVVGVGSASVADVFTREAAVYTSLRPGPDGEAVRLALAFGVGGSVRLLRVGTVAGTRVPPTADVDLGVRLGPAFSTPLGRQSDASRARAFAVMADPFVRGTLRMRSGRVVFAEVGPRSPNLRGGLALAFPR